MEYDLTKKLSTFLDAHLLFQLVDFAKAYKEEDINRAKADILTLTGRCDDAIAACQKVGRDTSALQEKKQKLATELETLRVQCDVVTQYLNAKKEHQQSAAAAAATPAAAAPVASTSAAVSTVPDDVDEETAVASEAEQAKLSFTFAMVREKITAEIIEALYRYSKLLFETGQYKTAKEYLSIYAKLSNDRQKTLSALWGVLESDILSQNWTAAVTDIAPLKEEIDSNSSSPVEQLHQRAWLIHRSLFVYFNQTENRAGLVDLLFDDKYLNAIQTVCPHVLRYLTVAIVINRRRPQTIYQLVKVIEQEAYTYRDPITQFVSSLYVKFNFEEAKQQLSLCEQVLKQDYFLASCYDEFMESSRACIFETYCNIHENIDIDLLCNNLGIPAESSEKWIVEAIRNARFVAKIDSANNQIKMFSQHTNAYRQVMDKTKGLFNRGIEILVGINDSRAQQSRRAGAGGDRKQGGQRRQQQQQQQQPAQAQAQAKPQEPVAV